MRARSMLERRHMRDRSLFILASAALLFPLLLIGCPQGAGEERFVDDDAGDGGDAGDATADEEGGTAPDASDPISSGALCGVNGQDQCGPFMTCSPTLGCVECAADEDCPAAARFCLQGQCVGCRPSAPLVDGGASDCPPGHACSSADFECHASCADTGGCADALRCDEPSGACVGCLAPADCPSSLCSTKTRLCVECESDDACSGQRPRCRLLTSTCVACLSNDDCGLSAPVCDPLTFSCRVGCFSDRQCPGQQCDLGTATCVALPDPTTDAGQ
ncbi:MAG: hypothetical protein KF782_20830 [Labilithrix sp.]|nr:hypothetical protein [Labilithrix sp.]